MPTSPEPATPDQLARLDVLHTRAHGAPFPEQDRADLYGDEAADLIDILESAFPDPEERAEPVAHALRDLEW